MDAAPKANSGHPGAPMMYKRRDVLCYDPDDVAWLNRDRFILSSGHPLPTNWRKRHERAEAARKLRTIALA